MIVYGTHRESIHIPAAVRTLLPRITPGSAALSLESLVDTFVDFGETYAAVADALRVEDTGETAASLPWIAAADALADAVCAAWDANPSLVGQAAARARAAIVSIPLDQWDGPVLVKPMEGFTQYALYPEQFAAAGGRLVDTLRPARLACIGIRSIGLPLAHICAASARLRSVRTFVASVRPDGHPFDRRATIPRSLHDALVKFGPDIITVVDEEPGLSGSSFASVVEALVECGISAERIALVPSWDAPEESLRSPRARAAWRTHRRFTASGDDLPPDLPARGVSAAVDLSAGRWRRLLLPETDWPPVQPQHERRKLLVGGSKPVVVRFAGFGRHGRAMASRAAILADAGFGVKPRELRHGWLTLDWVDGSPISPQIAKEQRFVDRLAQYLAFVKRQFGTGASDDLGELRELVAVNLERDEEATFAPAERCAMDARMLRHEWIDTGGEIIKTDALDHHADDFFPGCRDVAWDVAAAIVESGFDRDRAAALVARYVRATGDRDIGVRLPFYRTAYLAWRVGYTALAAETLGDSPDGRRFTADLRRYRRLSDEPAESPPQVRRC